MDAAGFPFARKEAAICRNTINKLTRKEDFQLSKNGCRNIHE
jgi:hypothetical protein